MYVNLSVALEHLGRYDEAEDAARKAIQLERRLSPKRTRTWRISCAAASSLMRQRQRCERRCMNFPWRRIMRRFITISDSNT